MNHTDSPEALSPETPGRSAVPQGWLNVMALAFAAFVFNTTEFVPIALLSDIGAAFGKTPGETGLMITVYAWVVALCSLPLMLATRRMERRKLLMWLFAVFVGGHIVSVAAWRFEVLLAGRVAIAFAHGVFWSITASLAMRVAPAGRGNQALGLLSTGSVLAMVLGMPIGRVLGQWASWKLSFAAIAVLAALTALVLARRLPLLPSRNSGSLSSIPALAKRKSLRILYLFITLMITAHFTAYSYIEPFARTIGGLPNAQITLLLLCYGAAGFAGSYLFGRCFAKRRALFFLGAVAAMAAVMLLLLPAAPHFWLLLPLCLLWGIGIMAVSLAAQASVLRLAPDATDVATSIFSALYNVGIGGGALLGRYAGSWPGLPYIGIIGGTLAAVMLLPVWMLIRQADFRGEKAA